MTQTVSSGTLNLAQSTSKCPKMASHSVKGFSIIVHMCDRRTDHDILTSVAIAGIADTFCNAA